MLSFGHAVYSGLGAYFAIHALSADRRRARSSFPVSLLPLVGGAGRARSSAWCSATLTTQARRHAVRDDLARASARWCSPRR
ncbi:MAG: hypothetical protein MZW92_48675 [Comamonadaceae bacterium]|nr:hypothetical protein [Comamonadaceae bacterium]